MSKSEIERRKLDKRSGRTRAMPSGWVQMIVTIVVVVLGAVGAYFLIKLRKPPAREAPETLAPLVEVEQLHVQDLPMTVRGYGTVSPGVEVEIVPEIPGKVVYVHPQLKPGGLLRAKEQIIQIDPRDYELAVQQAKAVVAEAQVRLDTEKAEADVAREEWEELHPDTKPSSPLVLREPQIRRAEASLESAKAQLAIADLRLERTKVSLPFDVLVINERVDLGQYVVVGQSLGAAYGVKSVEIEVPLEDKDLAWFDILDDAAQVDGESQPTSRLVAQVKADFAGAEHTWKGRVVRTTGQVDRTSRMISVIIEVTDPFDTSGGRPPLFPGVFAEVLIEGKVLKSAVAVPRDAVRQGNRVWVVKEGRLQIRTLEIARADKDYAYAVSGLDDQVLIVVSSIDMATDGMAVRTQVDDLTEAAQVNQDNNTPGEAEAN
jgi:RND family efflux transporter MFP subunit